MDNNENNDENNQFNGNNNMQSIEEKRKIIYNEACNFIPSTILRNKFTTTCKLLSETFNARREFSSQLGVHAAVQHLLCGRPLHPDDMQICFNSGVMISRRVTPNYQHDNNNDTTINLKKSIGSELVTVSTDTKGTNKSPTSTTDSLILERNVDVPFRLTRNIVSALSGSMLLGGTTVSLGVSLDSYLKSRDVVECSVMMLLHEDAKARQKENQSGKSARTDEQRGGQGSVECIMAVKVSAIYLILNYVSLPLSISISYTAHTCLSILLFSSLTTPHTDEYRNPSRRNKEKSSFNTDRKRLRRRQ